MADRASRIGSKDDTIVALSTPAGTGAIAIVRVDGGAALDLIRQLFHPEGPVHPADAPRRAIYGSWREPPHDAGRGTPADGVP